MPFYRQGLCKNAGSQILRQRLRVIHFHCASSLAVFPSDQKSHDFPAHLYVLIVCAFYLRQISGQCGPAPFTLRAAACICCRVTVNLHQNPRSFKHCTRPVRHFRCVKRQSDAQPPHRAMPLFSGLWRSFPNLTRLFGAAVSKKEEKKIDTEGGMMPRRTPARAGSPYSVLAETPYTSTSGHSGVKVSFWRSQKAYAGDCLYFEIGGTYGEVKR